MLTPEAMGASHTKSDGVLLFRHGFIAISLPHHGTLIIRNSSPVFGRNLLKHPAYYLEKSLSKEELKDFDPRTIPDNRHILHRNIVKSSLPAEPLTSVQKISELCEALLAFKDHYRRFKFDSQAFEGYGKDRHFSGQLSPGLPILLASWLNQKPEQTLDLAFVHPDYPIWKPYATFSFTPENAQEIRDFLTGSWNPVTYPNSPWIEFMTQGGIENRAELVLIDSKKPV
ncbi:MAG: hypothetical protein K2X66_14980 [Cyanobacteria bacterium]|nr:hypothetical protein [Cyanobacteriota bacterium]